ncbi:MAG: pyridoxamine 5'-phosphate oxidase [Betaproteobacteria bacterium AqS2]|uniref:Pyridoxine/pyridoxamine 5'-phosphate oxidase n=1 Tax=Candidatus Amphirhobacter heronislandensis TaxID=1732024 RepID=A0A930UHP6_9GAMM|nr:pyridoxamine 5'-phosphate oxidase [Betaproteobacteria bacterium AqS2]
MDASASPLELFQAWLDEARKACPDNPDAIALATADATGTPDVRYVLLKRISAEGLEFFTNRASSKGRQLEARPHAALAAYWRELGRQVRARGPVDELPRERVAEYFATRRRPSQLGAWASKQSAELAAAEELRERLAALEKKFAGQDVPPPEHWTGYRMQPLEIEFWQEGDARLHERVLYSRIEAGAAWTTRRLQP